MELEDFIPGGGGGLVIPKSILRKTSTKDTVQVGKLFVQLLHTPGHTPGSQCILVNGMLFTGDTLFVGTCGRCYFPYSDPGEMYQSLSRLKKLPPETVFYPGHDYGATPFNTIAKESQANPFLLANAPEQFLKMVRR